MERRYILISEYNSKIGLQNKESIRKYFQSHLCATNKECAEAFKLNYRTISRHVKSIRAEWNKSNPKKKSKIE